MTTVERANDGSAVPRQTTDGPDWQAEAMGWGKRAAELANELQAMARARDLCKRQTGDVEALRQHQVSHARTALRAIEVHGTSGVWTGEDCATHAAAALDMMSRPIDYEPPEMQEPVDGS